MSFVRITMDFAGQVGVVPRVGRLFTDKDYAQLTAPGLIYQGFDGNTYSPTDVIIGTYNDGNNGVTHGIFIPTFSSGVITLEDLSESGGLTPPINLVGQKSVLIPGTLALTNGSVDVVGTGTQFFDLVKYQPIWINNVVYYVDVITSDTTMSLRNVYAGQTASGVKAYIDDSFIICTDSSGEIVFEVGSGGQITTPLYVNNALIGAFHNVETSAVGLYVRPYNANGIIRLTNADPVHIAIGFLARYVDYKVGYEVQFIQVGSGFTSFFSGESDVLLFNTIDGAQPNFTQNAVCRAKLISVTGNNGTWLIEIVGSGAVQFNDALVMADSPWVSDTNATTVRLVKRDNVVNMTMLGFQAPIENATSPNNIVTTGDPIPAAFRPTEEIDGYVRINAGTAGAGLGGVTVYPNGHIGIGSNPDGTSSWAGVAGVTNVGFYTFSLSWVINYDEP